MTQPEALRLAAELSKSHLNHHVNHAAAAELRRLDAECNDLAHQLNQSNERNGRLIAQRGALLEALVVVLLEAEHTLLEPTRRKARAAIKAVEENT